MRRERLVPSVLSPVELDINLKIRQSPVDWLTSRHGGTSLASVCAGILCGMCACGEAAASALRSAWTYMAASPSSKVGGAVLVGSL